MVRGKEGGMGCRESKCGKDEEEESGRVVEREGRKVQDGLSKERKIWLKKDEED